MSFIDEQIISLKFDAEDFSEKVQDATRAISGITNTVATFKDESTTLGDRFKSVLNVVDSISSAFAKTGNPIAMAISTITSGVEKLTDKFRGRKVDTSNFEIAIDKVKEKFSAFETIATGALLTLGNQLVTTGEQMVKHLTIDQISEGWRKYAEIVRSTQVTLATGAGLEQTNDALRQLAWYADETSYSLTDMTSSISKFTSYGIAIEDAAVEIMGIDNAVAKAGGTIQMATSAQQAFQRAFSTGYMSLQIWRRQLTTSGLITEDFKEKCIEAGLALGTLERDSEGVVRAVSNGVEVTATGLEMTLSEAKWMTTEVMEYLLKGYASSTAQIEYIYNNLKGKLTTSEIIDQFGHLFDEYSLAAFKMAQEATTFEQAVESLGDTVSTQWNNIFSNIFGGYKEAKILWSELANWLIDTVATPVYDLVDLTNEWATTEVKNLEYYSDETRRLITEEKSVVANFRSLFAEGLLNIMKALTSYVNAFKIAWNSVFNSVTAKQLGDLTYKFVDFTEGLILSDEQMQNLAQKIQYVLATVKLVMNVLSALGKYVKDEIWPVVVKVIDIVREKLSGVSGVFGELYSRFSSFVEGLTGKSNTIMSISEAFKEWKEDMEGATVTEEQVIGLINEYNAKYSEMKDNLVDSAKTIDALTGSTKNFAKAFEEIDWANVTVEDINTLNSFVDELEQSDVYMNKAASSSKELEAELAKLQKAGYVTSEDISNLRDIIEKIGIASFDASSQVKTLTDKIRNTDWSTATEKDVRELREYTNAIKDSNVFMTDTQKIAKEYKDKLESIGKQGYATAEDISDLNDIVDKLDTSMRKSAESTEIISKALSEIDFSSADKNTADAMQRVSDALKNSSSYMSDASLKSTEFKSKLKDISKQGYVTASDIEDLNNIIKEFNSNVGDANTSTDLINKTLKNLDFTSLGSKTVGEMQNVIDKLKGTSTYLDETAEAGKEFENKLSSIAKQGYVTASDLKALDEMVKTLGGDLKNASESTKITSEALKTMNFDGSAKSVKDMEKVIEKLGKSSSYLDEAAELGAKFESELKSIGEQGNVTASNIASLNDIVDKLNSSMAKSSETTRIANQALSKFDFSDAGENTAEQMRYVVTELRKADTYFGSAAEQGKAFQDKLKSIADQGYATASDIRSLNNIIYEMEAATKSATEGWSEVALAMKGASELYDFNIATSETVSIMDDLISVISKSDGILTEADVATMEFNNELKKLGAQGYITSENIETLREKIQAIKDAMEDASAETTKTQKALKGALELYDFSKMNPEELMSFVNTIEQSATVISKADILSKRFTDKIREMSNQSKLSYTDFDDLKNIIYEYAQAIDEASIETSDMAYKAQAALEIIDWGKLSAKDLPTLREMVATIQSAGDSTDEFNELANQMRDKLYEIAQAGHATADDIEFLDNTMKKLNDLQEYNIWLNSDTAAALRAFQSKINSINQKGIVTIEDVEQLQKLYYQLSNTSHYTNKAGQAIEGLQGILSNALNTGSLTADNMSSIASWIDKLGEASLNSMGKNIAKTEEYGKVLDENGKILNETGRITHGLSEEYDENASKVSKVSNEILEYADNLKLQDKQIEDSSMSIEEMISAYDKLGKSTETSAIALSDLLKAAGYSDDAVQAILGTSELLTESNNKVNESQEKVNKSKYNSVYADRLQESFNKRKESSTTRSIAKTEKYTSAIEDQTTSTTNLVKSIDESLNATDKIANKTEDATSKIYENKKAIDEATSSVNNYDDAQKDSKTTTDKSNKSIGGIVDAFTELGKAIGSAFDYSKLGGNGTGSKDLSGNLTDLLGSINISAADIGKFALLAAIISKAIRNVLTDFTEIENSVTEATLDATGRLFKSIGTCMIELSIAIAIIVGSDWLFGGAGDAIKAVIEVVKITSLLILAVLLISKKYTISDLAAASATFVAIGLLFVEMSAAIALIAAFGGSSKDILVATLSLIKIVKTLTTLTELLAAFAYSTSTDKILMAGALANMMGAALLLISGAISIICYVNDKYGGAIIAAIGITMVIAELTKMIYALLVFAMNAKNANLKDLASTMLSMSALVLAIGVAIAAVGFVAGKYDLHVTILSFIAIRSVIEQLKDCIRDLIIFSSIFKNANLNGISESFKSLSLVVLAIGIAISAISFIAGKYDLQGEILTSARSIRIVIEQLKDCLRDLIIVSSLFTHADYNGLTTSFKGLSIVILAIGTAIAAISYVDGKYDINNSIIVSMSIRSVIEQMKDCLRQMIIISSLFEHANYSGLAKIFAGFSTAVLGIGLAISAISYVDGKYDINNSTKIAKALRSVIEQMKDCLRQLIIISSMFDDGDLSGVAKILSGFALAVLALGLALSAITSVGKGTDLDNVNEYAKILNKCIKNLGKVVKSIIVIGSIVSRRTLDSSAKTMAALGFAVAAVGTVLGFVTLVFKNTTEDKINESVNAIIELIHNLELVVDRMLIFSKLAGNSDKLEQVAKILASLAVPIAAAAGTIALICWLRNTYPNADLAIDDVTKIMKSIAIMAIGYGMTQIGQIDVSILTYTSSVFGSIGLSMLELMGCLAIMCKLYDKYGDEKADKALNSIYSIMLLLGLIAIGISVFNKQLVSVNIRKSTLSYVADMIKSIGLACLEISGAVYIMTKAADSAKDNNFQEAVDVVRWCIVSIGLIAVALAVVATQASSMKTGNIKAVADIIESMAIPILAIGICIGALALVANMTSKGDLWTAFGIMEIAFVVLSGVTLGFAALVGVIEPKAIKLSIMELLLGEITLCIMLISATIAALAVVTEYAGYGKMWNSFAIISAALLLLTAFTEGIAALSGVIESKLGEILKVEMLMVALTACIAAVSIPIMAIAALSSGEMTINGIKIPKVELSNAWVGYGLVSASIAMLTLLSTGLAALSTKLETDAASLAAVSVLMIVMTTAMMALITPVTIIAALTSGSMTISGVKIPKIEESALFIGLGVVLAAITGITLLSTLLANFTKTADTTALLASSVVFIAFGVALIEMAAACGIIVNSFIKGQASGVTRDVIDTVAVLIVGLAGAALAITVFGASANPTTLLAASVLFIAIGASLVEAAYAIKIISETYKAAKDGNVTFETLGTFALILAGMALVAAVIPTFVASASAPLIMASAVMFAALGLAMMEAAVAIKSICDSYEKYGAMVIAACTTAVTVVGLMAVIIGIMATSSGSSLMALASAGAIAIVAASTIALAYAFKELAGIKLEQVGTGLLAIGGGLAVVVAAGAVGQLCAVGLLAISGAILAVAAAVLIMATAWEKFNKTLTKSVDDIVKESTAGVDKTVDATLGEIEKKTEQATKEANEAFEEAAKQSLEGYEKGMNDKSIADDIEKAAVENMATNPTEAVESELDIHSPSRKFEKIGQYTLEGYYNGINDKSWTEKLKDSASSIGKSILDAFRDVLGIHSPSKEGESDGKNFDAGVKQGIDSDAKSVSDSAEKLGKGVDDAAKDGLGIKGNESSTAKEKGRIYATSLGGGLKDYFNGENLKSFFQDKISSFFSGAVSNVDLSGITDKLGESLKFDDLKIDTDSLTKNLQDQLKGMNGSLSLEGAVDTSSMTANVDTDDITAQYQQILDQSMAQINTQQAANNVDTEGFTTEFASTGVDATNALAQGMVDTSALKNVSSSGTKLKTTTVDSVNGKSGTSITDMIIGIARNATSSFTKTLESGIPEVKKIGTKILDGLKTGLSDSSIINIISNTSTKIKTKVVGMLTEIKTTLATKSAEIKTLASGLNENLRTHLDFSKIVDSVATSMTKLPGSISPSLSSMRSVMSNGGTEIANAAKTMMDRLNASLNNKSLFNNLGVIGKNIVTGIRNGILSNVQKMQNTGQTLAQRFRDAFKNVLGIHSPSRVMMNDAKYIVEGLVIGLDNNAIDAIDAGQSMGSKVADAIADSVNMANMLADQELSISPLITPVVDMQSIDNAINTLNSDLSSRDIGFTANAVGSVYNKSNAQNETVSQQGSSPSANVTYVQNNYSPKELSRIDIYRNTRNQLNGHYRTDQNPSAYRR